MTEKTYKIIEELATKLNTSTEVLWQTLVRQAKIDFWSNLIVWLVFGALTAVCIFWSRKLFHNERQNYDEPAIILSVIAGVLGVFWIIMTACGLSITLAAAFNPEYWALKQIIK